MHVTATVSVAVSEDVPLAILEEFTLTCIFRYHILYKFRW